jgi:nucleotide-binding universal stress UspA family protein
MQAKRAADNDGSPVGLSGGEAGHQISAKGSPRARANVQRILVPVDFSRESAKAVGYAVSLAQQFDASIMLVHVVEPSYGPAVLPGGSSSRPASEKERNARAKSKLAVLGHRILGPCRIVETVIRNGLAFFEITEAASALNADLIVIGTHGDSGPTPARLGSTAENVVRHAPCPVLVVRRHEQEFIV